MAKEGNLKMDLDDGALHAAKFSLESLPGVAEILTALTDDERSITVNLVRMDNLASSFEQLAQVDQRLFPAYEQIFEIMESIAMDMVHAAMKCGNISKERYFELCDLADKIVVLAKEHAESTVDSSNSLKH